MAETSTQTVQFVEETLHKIRIKEPLSPEEEEILSEVNEQVQHAESLDEVMNFLFEAVKSISPTDRLGLAFVEEDGKRIVEHWAKARYEPLLLGKGYAEDLHESSLMEVLEYGKPRIINSLQQHLTAHPDSRSSELLVREGVRSSLTCPLLVAGKRVGLLFRSSRQEGAYNLHHVRMHLEVADRLSHAVATAYRIEQLDAASKAYMEMLGFVSHELKGPLASIMMDGRLLVDEYLGPLNERQKEKLATILRKADILLSLVREYLDLARIEGGELRLRKRKEVDFGKEVIAPGIEQLQPQINEKNMLLTLDMPDDGPVASCDPALMKIVITNLLGNAVKYGVERGNIILLAERTKASLVVSVWNEGPGFPEEESRKLFRKFARLSAPELTKRKGTGVGLYTCWRIVRLHGGKIWARSEYGQWAEFAFRIPQP